MGRFTAPEPYKPRGRSLAPIFNLLSALSGVEANPNFVDPTEPNYLNNPPVEKPSPEPFKGKGPFGGIEASRANAKFALDSINRARDFEDFKRQLEETHKAQLGFRESDLKLKDKLENQFKEEEYGRRGEAFGMAAGSYSPEQVGNVFGGGIQFGSPADQYRFLEAKFGGNKPFEQMVREGDPRSREGAIGADYLKQFYTSGGSGYSPLTGRGFELGRTENVPEIVKLQSGEREVADLATETKKMVPTYREDVVNRSKYISPREFNIKKVITQEDSDMYANPASAKIGPSFDPYSLDARTGIKSSGPFGYSGGSSLGGGGRKYISVSTPKASSSQQEGTSPGNQESPIQPNRIPTSPPVGLFEGSFEDSIMRQAKVFTPYDTIGLAMKPFGVMREGLNKPGGLTGRTGLQSMGGGNVQLDPNVVELIKNLTGTDIFKYLGRGKKRSMEQNIGGGK